jgi:hypothetical protein
MKQQKMPKLNQNVIELEEWMDFVDLLEIGKIIEKQSMNTFDMFQFWDV